MLPRRLTECSQCEIWAGGGGRGAFPYLPEFFSGFSVRKLRSQRTESGWREGQRENFLSTNTLCHLILNDWIVFLLSRASPVAQMVKNLPAMQETWVQSLGREYSPGEGNGNPLQYSCLENSMDRGAWWATVHGVARVRQTEQLNHHHQNVH